MFSLRKSAPAAVLLASLALSGSAFAASAQADYDHHADFTQYKAYSWGKVTVQDPLLVDRIKNAVNQSLQASGWQLVPSGAKTTIFVTGQVTDEKQLESTYIGMAPSWGGSWDWSGWGWGSNGGILTTTADNKKMDNLVIDIFDSATRALLFRGVAQLEVKKDTGKTTKELDKDIAKIFSKFPPQ